MAIGNDLFHICLNYKELGVGERSYLRLLYSEEECTSEKPSAFVNI